MGTARRLVELGRQARTDSGHRIRQPLARALVAVPTHEVAGLALVAHEIAEELNLHAVELADADGGVVDRSLRPNFRALGPAFGADAPRIAGALTGLDTSATETLLAEGRDGGLHLDVGGASFTLTPDMYEVVEMPRTGWSVARDGSFAIALDTTLTPDLEVEGAARELVRAVNEQRKATGLDLADRIRLEVRFEPHALGGRIAAAGHLAVVEREVLATSIVLDAPLAAGPDVAEVPLGELGSAWLRVTRT
jgi:isoleucyl-tRNA synthetase